jgi:hypothetical protein
MSPALRESKDNLCKGFFQTEYPKTAYVFIILYFSAVGFSFLQRCNNRVSNTLITGIGLFESKIEAKFYALEKIFILLYLQYFLICIPGKGSG